MTTLLEGMSCHFHHPHHRNSILSSSSSYFFFFFNFSHEFYPTLLSSSALLSWSAFFSIIPQKSLNKSIIYQTKIFFTPPNVNRKKFVLNNEYEDVLNATVCVYRCRCRFEVKKNRQGWKKLFYCKYSSSFMNNIFLKYSK